MEERLLEKAIVDYGNTVLRAAFSVTGNRLDAEDVFSDVFFRLFKRTKAFEGEAHLKAWLIRCAVNLARNIKTSAWTRHRAQLDESLAATSQDADLDLQAAMKNLSMHERTIIYLHYYEGYAYSEIASILKMRQSSVRSHAFRARAQLKELLAD